MIDLISYLGGEKPVVTETRRIQLVTKSDKLDTATRPVNKYQVKVKLDGGLPGKILNDPKANLFLDQVDYYIRNPNELV